MSREKSIEIDVPLELRDLLRANYWHFFKRFKLFLILLVIGCVGYPALHILGGGVKNPNDNYWGFLIPFGMLVFLLGSTYLGVKRQMASNKSLSEPHRFTFSENGIDAVAQSSSGHTSWANIYEAYETKYNFLLFLSRNMMYTVPKRCFRDGEQLNSFKELLKTKLSSKAKLK
jgi:hypothetical protein